MSSRCRFCGGKIVSDAVSCEHCGKQLRKSADPQAVQRRATNLESWKGRTIPAWLMCLVVGFFLACLVIMFLDAGTDPKPAQPPATPSHTSQPADHQTLEKESGEPNR